MIIQRKRGLQAVIVLTQGILITVVFAICALATFNLFTSATWSQIVHYPMYLMVITAGLFLESIHRDQGAVELSHFEESFPRQHHLSMRQTFYAIGALFVYVVITKDANISRIFVAVCFPMFYLTLLLSNRYLARRLAAYLFSGVRLGRVLLVGDPAKARTMELWLASKKIFGIQTIGILHDEAPETELFVPYLGSTDQTEQVIRREAVTQVILLELPMVLDRYRQLISTLESQGVRLLILNNLEEKLNHPICYIEDDRLRFVGLRQEPLENPLNRISKRMLDVAIALPVVIFILPVAALLVAIIQRLNSPGPLIFRQMRAGLHNNQFEILKFRTMRVESRASTEQATREDIRVFRGGNFLRRYSIDELPQFWNVLRGDMSLVGPRPHLLEHNEKFARAIANFPIRMILKPGITGLAQVRGFRGEAHTVEAIEDRLLSDLEYLENWRLTLDVMIIARTATQMFSPPKTAY